jgi:glucose-6-phosphate-specific signal transduction histidine kinase
MVSGALQVPLPQLGVLDSRARDSRVSVAESKLPTVKALSRRLLDLREKERRYLARELHDEIGQMLTALGFVIERRASGPAGTSAGTDEAASLVKELLNRVRKLSLDLRPTMLDESTSRSYRQARGDCQPH